MGLRVERFVFSGGEGSGLWVASLGSRLFGLEGSLFHCLRGSGLHLVFADGGAFFLRFFVETSVFFSRFVKPTKGCSGTRRWHSYDRKYGGTPLLLPTVLPTVPVRLKRTYRNAPFLVASRLWSYTFPVCDFQYCRRSSQYQLCNVWYRSCRCRLCDARYCRVCQYQKCDVRY